MKFKLLIILLLLNGCNPLFSAGGLMHSVVTNNTVSTILGLGDVAIKEKTGKSAGKHLFENIFRNNDLEKKNNKDVKWIFKKNQINQ
tara:strand:- start:163 stop:423 length:261 start_codon:yes stop_codon:yes gene_type:complete